MKPHLNILFLLPELPYPVSDGMRQKTFNLLKILATHHTCDVISFYSEGKNQLDAARIALPEVNFLSVISLESCITRSLRAILNLFLLLPPSFARFQNRKFISAVIQATERKEYDVVHYDIINIAQYQRYLPFIPSVHSPNDATSLCSRRRLESAKTPWQKFKLTIASKLLERYEKRHYGAFSKIHVVSKNDAQYLNSGLPADCVEYIPLGIADFDRESQPGRQVKSEKLVLVLGESNLQHVSAGLLEFLDEAAPELLGHTPRLKIQLHGKGTQAAIAGHPLSKDGRIEISAWVDNLNTLICSADVVVLPDKSGTGVKTRALQAMACGAAVVGTPAAFEGISDVVHNGTHCIIVDTPFAIAGAVKKLLSDQAACEQLGNAAAELIKANFSWKHLAPQYERLYFSAIDRWHA